MMPRTLVYSRRLSDAVFSCRASLSAYGAGSQRLVLLGLGMMLAVVFLFGLTVGPVSIAITDVWFSLRQALSMAPTGSANDWVVRELRLPRALLAMIVGAGLAVAGVMAGAATGVLTYAANDQQLRDMTFWSMGSLASGRWQDVMALAGLIGVPLLLSLRYRRLLNALLMGEQVAIHLGFDVQRSKRWLLAFAALMVGAGVAVTGIIGFVGLVVPHLLRMVMGSDHRGLIPASALGGALLLLVADTLARTWMAPADLPVGLVMALLGGPIFLLLLVQQTGGQRR